LHKKLNASKKPKKVDITSIRAEDAIDGTLRFKGQTPNKYKDFWQDKYKIHPNELSSMFELKPMPKKLSIQDS
jgi:hypothetical protein